MLKIKRIPGCEIYGIFCNLYGNAYLLSSHFWEKGRKEYGEFCIMFRQPLYLKDVVSGFKLYEKAFEYKFWIFHTKQKVTFSNYRFTKPFTSFIAISFYQKYLTGHTFCVRKGWSLLKLISLCWNFARFTRPVHGKGPTWPCYFKIVIKKTMLCIDLIHYMYSCKFQWQQL